MTYAAQEVLGCRNDVPYLDQTADNGVDFAIWSCIRVQKMLEILLPGDLFLVREGDSEGIHVILLSNDCIYLL